MNSSLTRAQRSAGFVLALSVILEAVLSSCAPSEAIRRPQEDAWLLSIAGAYQLTGELPAAPTEGVSKVARVAAPPFRPPGQPKTPNEAYSLMEYYMARAKGRRAGGQGQGPPGRDGCQGTGPSTMPRSPSLLRDKAHGTGRAPSPPSRHGLEAVL